LFPGTVYKSSPQELDNTSFAQIGTALNLGYIGINENGIDRQIGVFEVKLGEGVVLERNRVALRNLLRKYWQNLDGAFVVYFQGSTNIWRFTYVSELSGFNDSGEYVNIKTDPKRYTYIFGEGEICKTAVERFINLAKKGNSVVVEDIIEAFSVEKLSKSFFESYKRLYEDFCGYLTKNRSIYQPIFNGDEKEIRDFTKLLLGRITFIYFIQKKGWLGVPVGGKWGEGDTQFLLNLYRKYEFKSLFYKNVLTKLFFDNLNTKRENDLIELTEGEFIKIPFLNGGLFEEQNIKYREIIFEEQLFEELFAFFNQYNFTIYEDDPTDHTVAVDPEMLGHIFENLLEDNKDKGAFYTPKEIVHYMCQESLIEYLTVWFENKGYEVIGYASFKDINTPRLFSSNDYTIGQMEFELPVHDDKNQIDRILIEKLLKKTLDETDRKLISQHIDEFNVALDSVKICDPAIGSGAFPMGLLLEIFSAKQTLWFFKHGNLNNFPASEVKLNIIQNSIYGVDIEKGAVDIARLRFWLSLVVDEVEPKALPNLDYKIVVGNSLVSKFGDDIIDIDETAHGFFAEQTILYLQTQAWTESIKQLKELKGNPSLQLNFFDWKLNFPEILNELVTSNPGFDIVIANPPYIGVKGNHTIFDEIKKSKFSAYLKGRSELFYFFILLGIKLGKHHSVNAFITTNYFITASDADILRKSLKEETTLLKLLNFNEMKLFPSAQGQHNMVTIFKKGIDKDYLVKSLITKYKGFPKENVLSNIFDFTDSNTDYFINRHSDMFEGEKCYIRIGGKTSGSLLLKSVFNAIMNTEYTLGDICFVRQGLRTGIDKLTDSHIQKYDANLIKGGGVFILSEAELLAKGIDKNDKLIRPLFKNSAVGKYYCNTNTDKFLIYLDNTISLNELKSEHTSIYNHLLNYKSLIRNIRNQNNENSDRWYILDRPREEWIFEGEKIVAPQRSRTNAFGFNDVSWYSSADVYYIKKKSPDFNLKYILALLNSKLFFTWLFYKGKRKGDMLELYQQPLSEIPIKWTSTVEQIVFAKIAEEIICRKSQAKETFHLEQQIDNLVYRLYDLSWDEVRVIDPGVSLTEEEYKQKNWDKNYLV
jgi:hypothetical protein